MMMSEREICFRFKRNGCRKKHVKILAELNDVEPFVIEHILTDNGLIRNQIMKEARTLAN